jgi:hypothetical protein
MENREFFNLKTEMRRSLVAICNIVGIQVSTGPELIRSRESAQLEELKNFIHYVGVELEAKMKQHKGLMMEALALDERMGLNRANAGKMSILWHKNKRDD